MKKNIEEVVGSIDWDNPGVSQFWDEK